MEGIERAIKYIAELAVEAAQPSTVEIDGKKYSTKNLIRYDTQPKAEPIKATTLTSLVDYIKERRDELRDRMIVQVVDPESVALFSGLMEERDRELLFIVTAQLPYFHYGNEYEQEAFLVAMQACFQPSPDREAVTVLASNIVNTQSATYSDDGISQQAIMQTGITTKDKVLVPNPVKMIPYRTFLEVEQPQSEFVFRIGEGGKGTPVFKLVEADGGRWKSEAMAKIKAYLEKELADIPDRDQITIIA